MNSFSSPFDPRKILVIKPSALGDVVHSLPVLQGLRERFPDAEIHWLVARGIDGILSGHPMIEKLWIIDKDQWKRKAKIASTVRALRTLARELHRARFDLVIDLQGLFRSGAMALFTRAPVRIGFREAREGAPLAYTHRVAGGREIHAVDRYLKVAGLLDCPTAPVEFPFAPENAESARLVASLPSEYAVIAPSAAGTSKRWPAERFGELAARLPLPSVIVAGAADAPLARVVAEASQGKAISLAGRTSLNQLVAVIRRGRYLVCPDTGPMHIAAAVGVKVYALFGPTNPLRTGPYGAMHTVIREPLSCSPCYRRKPCEDMRCMHEITVDRVMHTIAAQENMAGGMRR